MEQLFTLIVFQPLFNLLVWIYNSVPTHDLGIAIILLTGIVKATLAPFSWKQIQTQYAIQKVQPHLEELKARHKDDKQAMMQAQMKLFSEHKINPLSSCLPLLIQLPFLFGLFYVFTGGIEKQETLKLLYPFVQNPGSLNTSFLGILSLSAKNDIILAIFAGVSQFIQTKMMMPQTSPKKEGTAKDDFASVMNTQMLYAMPAITGFMSYSFPNALGLYWVSQTVLAIAQQYLFSHLQKKNGGKRV